MKQKSIEDLMPKPTRSFFIQKFCIDFVVCYFMAILLMIPLFNVIYLRSMMEVLKDKRFRKLQKK